MPSGKQADLARSDPWWQNAAPDLTGSRFWRTCRLFLSRPRQISVLVPTSPQDVTYGPFVQRLASLLRETLFGACRKLYPNHESVARLVTPIYRRGSSMATIETSPATRNRFLYVIAPLLLMGLAADQSSKSWASSRAAEPRILVPGYLAAYSVQNAGATLGVNGDQAWTSTVFAMFGIVCASIVGLVAYRDRTTWRRADCLAGALLLAGIFGNTVDRVALGHVRDFLVTWVLPTLVFNVADLLVVVGCVALFMARSLSRGVAKSSSACSIITRGASA